MTCGESRADQRPQGIHCAAALKPAWERVGDRVLTATEDEAWQALAERPIADASLLAWYKAADTQVKAGKRSNHRFWFGRELRARRREVSRG
jgi:hypothetical protein